MQSLASLFVTVVVFAIVGAGQSRAAAAAPIDRHAAITQAVDDGVAAAPLAPDALVASVPALPLRAPLVFAAPLSLTPRRAPTAKLRLYLRDRALLL